MEMNENSVELQEEAVPASAESESVEESVEEISEAVGEEAAEAEQPPEEENIPDHVWERARKVAEARYILRRCRMRQTRRCSFCAAQTNISGRMLKSQNLKEALCVPT